jgi:serine/threonine protein kinase
MALRPYPGLEIDGFTLGERLHRGGFATIWDVTHPDHPIPMVMKVPSITDGYDAPTIVGFEIEQMIMPRLSGPHVPKVIAIGDFSVMPYIVTERIDGQSLVMIFNIAPRPISEIVDLISRMARAVRDLHKQHVIHLDLKPDNFLERADGTLVAIDFGLSRHDQLPDLLAEEFEIPMGTYPYIAPEQFLKQRDDLRSDLYAMGAMAYELATGRAPFGKPERLSGVRRRLWQRPVPPRALNPEIPEWLQEIILRALEVDPKDRYQSAAQMLFDLTHPEQVPIGERGKRIKIDSFTKNLKRWWRSRSIAEIPTPPLMTAQIDKAPVVMAAVDLTPEMEAIAERLLQAVRRMLIIEPDARVACVNVIKTKRLGLDTVVDSDGNHIHVARLVALRAWAARLDLPEERVTCTVLENTDPGTAIIDYARHNQVDHILMGARGHSTTRRYLGSVSSQVVSEAHCSVSVIRIPDWTKIEAGDDVRSVTDLPLTPES